MGCIFCLWAHNWGGKGGGLRGAYERQFKKFPYATSTFPTMHLICAPKVCITFFSHFSLVLQPSPEKLKTMLMQHFGR